MALSGTKALLVWAQRTTEGYKDVHVTNMQKSWKDGLAFCAILHYFRPDLIDFNSLSKENVHENNKLAFDIAEQELGIPALLDPDDMATMHVPDKLSIMTYLSQYYNYFKNKTPVKNAGGQKARVGSKRPAGESPLHPVPNKQPSMGDSCAICGKKVYLVERQVADGKLYHRNCFRCTKCSNTLRPGGYKTTSSPKKFECLEHGDNIWKLRANIASRANKEKTPAADGGSSGIWETRQGAAGSPWEKRADEKPAPNAKPVLRDGVGSIWEARAGLKSVVGTVGNQQERQPVAKVAEDPKPALPSQKPALPMHPHLLASKASRERFNTPTATQEPKTVKPTPDLGSPEKRPVSDAAKTEETRQGLLASLAAVRANVKPDKAPSKEDLQDVTEGQTNQKLATGEEDSKDPSPAGSNWSLLSDAKISPKEPSVDGETHVDHSEAREKPSTPEPDKKTDDEPVPASVDSHSRDSGHTSSDVFSLTSLSSISQTGNSETSSLDAERANFASGIEQGKRSSAFSGASSSDHEGMTGANLNLSDSFCMGYHADEIEGDSASVGSAEDQEPSDAKAEAPKEDHKAASKAPVDEKEESKPEKPHSGYDESLNPFGDDDEDEEMEEVKKEDDGYVNPFGEYDSEEEEDNYDENLNPFGCDGEDDATPTSPVTQWPPPLPGAEAKAKESLNQQGSYKVKTRQEILQEMKRDRHTLKKSQKRPAPSRPENAPPRPEGAPPRPGSDTHRLRSTSSPCGGSPRARSRKSRHAPPPPKENGQCPELQKDGKLRPDRPPPPQPSLRDQRAHSELPSRPVPSPRLKKTISVAKDVDGRISPIPSPRRKHSDGLKPNEASPVPSPRMRIGTDLPMARKKVMTPPRPTSDPIKPPTPQGSKKRAPAPPPIKREVDKHHVDPSVIQKELVEIELEQRELESKGVQLEQNLRTGMAGKDGLDNEDLLVEWFALVNEKNQLLRREGELVAQAQMQDLELQQAEIEYELRCLMHKHEHQKTDADNQREETLLEMLVEAVTKRSQIVERLEDDRKREEAEDEDIQIMMEQSGLDKKNPETKKHKKKRAKLLGK